MCLLEEAESSEGGRPALVGLSAVALRMYFGVSDRLHLLSQKQVWSRPRVLRPQGKRILTLHGPSSPGQSRGIGTKVQAEYTGRCRQW